MRAGSHPTTNPSSLWRWCVVLALLGGVLMLLSLSLGPGDAGLGDLWADDPRRLLSRRILLAIRLPRVLLGFVLGGALSVAGVVFQALLRNPLADPYILGVSGGASVGGVVALMLGLGTGVVGHLAVPAFAFGGALGTLALIKWVTEVQGRLSVYTVLLTGVVFNAFSGAVIYFLQSIASLEGLQAIVFYLMGSVPVYGIVPVVGIGGAVMLAGIGLLPSSRPLNLLSVGEEGAFQLGVDVERLKRRGFVLASLLTALSVSVAGLIGFVGLVVPHLLRLLLGPDHRLLLPAAFLGGGTFLLTADLLARTLLAPTEIPVGVITALLGGPFFLSLLRRSARGGDG